MSTQGCMLPHHPALGQAPSSAGTQRLSHEKSSAETGRVPKLQSRALLPETAESRPLCVSSSACLASCLSAPAVSVSSRPPPSSVGTFARALDCSSSVRQPSLHMSAAAASRDITLVSRCQPSKAQHVCLGQPPGHGPTQGRALDAQAWQPHLRTGSG